MTEHNLNKNNLIKNDRRNIIKSSFLLTLGTFLVNKSQSIANNSLNHNASKYNFELNDDKSKIEEFSLVYPFNLPKLEYGFDALEPNIDKMTMEIHYSKHHQGYINNLNKIIEGNPSLQNLKIEEVIDKITNEKVDNGLKNNAGGHYNHTFFWNLLTAKQMTKEPTGDFLTHILRDFGSLDRLKISFDEAAKSRFGSGWAWLVYDSNDRRLKITSTPNQDNPLMTFSEIKGEPIIGLDVWEHAYYLKYQNKRADYIGAFWNVLDWTKAEINYNKATLK